MDAFGRFLTIGPFVKDEMLGYQDSRAWGEAVRFCRAMS